MTSQQEKSKINHKTKPHAGRVNVHSPSAQKRKGTHPQLWGHGPCTRFGVTLLCVKYVIYGIAYLTLQE
jgi:hypothetical protein